MSSNNDKIAVIGMACRYPGAKNITEFWNNLINGRDTIKHFTDDELSRFEKNYDELKKNSNYVKARGVLEDIDKFDTDFFGITPEEAAETDPQHRVWLEVSWEAFEHAGCDPINYKGSIGVFAGGTISTYLLGNILRFQPKLEKFLRFGSNESLQMMVGNDATHIPTKTAYHFNLKGPAINVQTACSTSLVAISQACQSLSSFESDICLAGGVSIIVPQESGYIYQEGGIPSPDGNCRTFDLKGQGTVFSNGVGAVVLKRLEDAIHDGDMIYAIIGGWALNNDGKNKVSYMAPSVNGQAEVIMMAQSFAGIKPDQIGYIEAHGTATQLGDPLEITALKKAFAKETDKKQFCGIGSVKSNIGHTDVAAGVASFIKTCMAAYFRKIPPTIHYSAPNKYIKFENTPFYVLQELKEWTEEKPLIMGVSSFGVGGTNAHVIIEEPPRREKSKDQPSDFLKLIVLSAKSKESLQRRKQDLLDFINSNPELDVNDISFTLASGRNHMSYRSFIVVSDTSEINNLHKFIDGMKDDLISKIAFMFPGEGAQFIGIGIDLYKSIKHFREIMDECFEIIKSETGEDLKSLLFETTILEEGELKLARTELAQAALFIIEYALVKILEQIKIKPDFLIGHGLGEFTAACVAGVFDLQSALKIVIKRAQIMKKMAAGMLIEVRTNLEKLQTLERHYFEIVADNSSRSCYISFAEDNYLEVKKSLEENEIEFINLDTQQPIYFDSFVNILSEFKDFFDQFKMNMPKIPFISCLTGKFIKPEEAVSGTYWAQQLQNTIQFRNGITSINENENVIFMEVGPGTLLRSFAEENGTIRNKAAIISTLGKPSGVNETYKLIDLLGKIYNIGLEPDYPKQRGNAKSMKISLPTYPFKRDRHWIDSEYNKTFGRAD